MELTLHGTTMREQMIRKVQTRIENQKFQYKQLKSALTGFQDSSISVLGKLGYASSTIQH